MKSGWRICSLILLVTVLTGRWVRAQVPPLPPVAIVSVSPNKTLFKPGEPVLFNGSASYDPEGVITEYQWYVDGVLKEDSYNATTYTTSFSLSGSQNSKTVQVELKLRNNYGQTDSKTLTVTIQREQRFYYLTDHLGSVRVTVNEAGDPVGYDDYYPFGKIMPGRSNNTANPNDAYKFTGKERDSETGLDYFGARYYDAEIGRWLSIDPLAEKYPGLSPYVYTLNNPVALFDSDGKEPDWYLNVFNGRIEYHPGSANRINQGLVDLAPDNASVGDIKEALKVRGLSHSLDSKGIAVDTRQMAKAVAMMEIFSPSNVGIILGLAGLGTEDAGEVVAGKRATDAAKTSTLLVRTETQFSKHSLERLAQRGVTPKMAETTIDKGLKFYDPKNGTINYVLQNGFASGKSLLVGTNPLTGQVTTVIRSSKNLVNSRFIPIK